MMEKLDGKGYRHIDQTLKLQTPEYIRPIPTEAAAPKELKIELQEVGPSVQTPLEQERPRKPEKILASVIVNAFNEEAEIGRLLESLKKSWFPGMEIIISDDGSTDSTSDIVKKHISQSQAEKPHDWLILDSHENLGFAGAKNSGAARARGDYLLFFDADAPIPTGLLREDVRQMEDKKLDIATHTLMPQYKLQKYNTALKNKITLDAINQVHGKSAIAGCGGILIKKSVFEKVGGFRKMPIGEDTDIWRRVMQVPGTHMGMIEGVKMPVNMRRFEKQGYMRTLWKWTRAWISSVLYEKDRERRAIGYGPSRRNLPISQQEQADF